MQQLDWILVVLYLAGLLATGLFFYRSNDSAESNTLGTNSIPS